MRLINADSLLQVIRKNIPKNPHDEYQEGQEIGLSMAVEMVCNEPTVDAEPVIRCKDCKYWAEFTFAQPPKNYCGRLIQADYNNHDFGFEMDEDDFCSMGERREKI